MIERLTERERLYLNASCEAGAAYINMATCIAKINPHPNGSDFDCDKFWDASTNGGARTKIDDFLKLEREAEKLQREIHVLCQVLQDQRTEVNTALIAGAFRRQVVARLKLYGIPTYEMISCRRCGKKVEKARESYSIPTCFACLPPPPPMTIAPVKKPRKRKPKIAK